MIRKHWVSILFVIVAIVIIIASIIKSLSFFETLTGLAYLLSAYLCTLTLVRMHRKKKDKEMKK